MRDSEGPIERFPRLGENAEELLRSTLSLDDSDLAELQQREVISGPQSNSNEESEEKP